MPFDPKKIRLRTTRRAKETDPEAIFESLTLRGSIENLWSPQAEALREWHTRRDESDTVIEMNTGGGKTLVGLLVAQSLVNETGKHVLFVCPTKQLIEQATAKARECGMSVATYMAGEWSHPEVADEGRGPCITNYAAVFNGKSIFARQDLGGIVFDDAHVAGNIIRSQFTLKYENGETVYEEIIKRLRKHFARNSQSQRLDDAMEGDPRAILFAPIFESRRLAAELAALLVANGVEDERHLLFPWEHVKDHLDRCVIVVSGTRLEIAPSALPLHRLSYLQGRSRRVYLTATLPSPVEFVKTFGVSLPSVIHPRGKSGEAQRLFVFADGENDDEQRVSVKALIADRKACMIVPSSYSAEKWRDVAEQYTTHAGQAGIDEFAEATDDRKLILVARYDGIDLPGAACRVLVIDGLPRGAHLLDRFLDEHLQALSLRASHSAIRMVQAIGRIFRSNTDHGAVVLVGGDVTSWSRSPANRVFLPPLLQKQIQLGLALRESVDAGETTFAELLAAVTTGDRNWDEFYEERIEEFKPEPGTESPKWLVEVALHEQQAYQHLWEGNCTEAASMFAGLADEVMPHDRRLSAWCRHWEGAALDFGGNRLEARRAYIAAANIRSELGRPVVDARTIIASGSAPEPGAQATAIATIVEKRRAKALADLDEIASDLQYGPGTNPVEQAIKVLGECLGLSASRPDRQEGTGPDVEWHHSPSKSGAALEAKTNKKEESQYTKKDDIGQFHDHARYLETAHPGEAFRKIIVGRTLPVSKESHPPGDLQIVELEQFQGLTAKVRELYAAVLEHDGSERAEVVVQRWLDHLGLNWPDCVDSLPSSFAVDLQHGEATESVGE